MDLGYKVSRFVIAPYLPAPISPANWLIASFSGALFSSCFLAFLYFVPTPDKWPTLYIQISGQKAARARKYAKFCESFYARIAAICKLASLQKK